MSKLYNTKEAAEFFRVNPKTIGIWRSEGILPGFKAGRDWRFTEEDIQQCIANLRQMTIEEDEERGRIVRKTGRKKSEAVTQ